MKSVKMDKGTVLITVVSIITLLVAIIGATFAWFSATVKGNEEASSVTVKTATLGISYNGGNEIKLQNALPNASATKTFTIAATAETNANQEYDINWNIDTFDFVNPEDLVYSLTGETDGNGTVCEDVSNVKVPTADGKICTGQIEPNETHTYTLNLLFKETGSDQNANQGKQFLGKIEVAARSVSA